jgi:hypothetical protein
MTWLTELMTFADSGGVVKTWQTLVGGGHGRYSGFHHVM